MQSDEVIYVHEHMPPIRNPRVFISYSHDSDDHIQRVIALADRLCNEGIDCNIDEYEQSPTIGWQDWMIMQVKDSDYVLVICTKRYLDSFEGRQEPGVGLGVAWEGAIITQDLYRSATVNAKFIPVLLSGADRQHIPTLLASATYYDLNQETGYERLYRRLTNQPEVRKPPLGNIRQLKARQLPSETEQQATEESIRTLSVPLKAALPRDSCAEEPMLIRRLRRGSWLFDEVADLMPSLEATYQSHGELANFVEHAYDGGALRLYLTPNKTEVFGIAVDTLMSAYSAFQRLTSTDDYVIYKGTRYAVICRIAPLDDHTFNEVIGRKWSLPDLTQRLGEFSYRLHLHGIGETLLAFIPKGLTFAGSGTFRLSRPAPVHGRDWLAYDGYMRAHLEVIDDFARWRTQQLAGIAQAIEVGKLSPGGQYRLGTMGNGVYWDNWLIIHRTGHAELRHNPGYFIQDFHWLDSERVVYATKRIYPEHKFFTLNATTGNCQPAAEVKGEVSAFGVVAPGHVWYQTANGNRHEIMI